MSLRMASASKAIRTAALSQAVDKQARRNEDSIRNDKVTQSPVSVWHWLPLQCASTIPVMERANPSLSLVAQSLAVLFCFISEFLLCERRSLPELKNEFCNFVNEEFTLKMLLKFSILTFFLNHIRQGSRWHDESPPAFVFQQWLVL